MLLAKEFVLPVKGIRLEIICRDCGNSLTVSVTKETHKPVAGCPLCNNVSDAKLNDVIAKFRQFLVAVGDSDAIRFRVAEFDTEPKASLPHVGSTDKPPVG